MKPPHKVEFLSEHSLKVRCLCYSPNGEWLASGSSDKKIFIYDSITFYIQYKLEDHNDQVLTLDFNP